MGAYFKNRLNYLADRLTGKAGWGDMKLDFVPIAYYRGGYIDNATPILIEAQVGRSQTETLMGDGQIAMAKDRDYFIFFADLGFEPQENDVILDDNYQKWYQKVATRFTRSTFDWTNETTKRMRVRTVCIHAGDMHSNVPDQIATWLRAGIKPGSRKYMVPFPTEPE